mgnify:CR=1 FL=1
MTKYCIEQCIKSNRFKYKTPEAFKKMVVGIGFGIEALAGLLAGSLSPEGHKLAIAVIAMSLLVSPIFFLGARFAHRLAMKHLGLSEPAKPLYISAGADI